MFKYKFRFKDGSSIKANRADLYKTENVVSVKKRIFGFFWKKIDY